MVPQTVDACWKIAFNEAERYQSMLLDGSRRSERERWELTAKRDTASRIARLIKFGASKVGGVEMTDDALRGREQSKNQSATDPEQGRTATNNRPKPMAGHCGQ